ncbi:MAG TPA: S1 RNA-binding domain-containing protein, partial [Flavobacterium sp.]|nr:S1 RNA-binding domain-containing protein [Flavobacterium sp.]
TNFGAFVDIGVHQDGLVHTSQLANRFVANPNEVVKVSQVVQVTVTDIDVERKRISLSMKEDSPKDGKSGSPKGNWDKEQGAKNNDNFQKQSEQNRKPYNQHQPKKEKEVDGDLQTKLAKLKGMFK